MNLTNASRRSAICSEVVIMQTLTNVGVTSIPDRSVLTPSVSAMTANSLELAAAATMPELKARKRLALPPAFAKDTSELDTPEASKARRVNRSGKDPGAEIPIEIGRAHV